MTSINTPLPGITRPQPAHPPGDTPWLYLLLSLLGTAGFFYVNLAAAIVDGLTGSLGFSSGQAGNVMSANIYGVSVGGLIAVLVVRRFPWRVLVAGPLCVSLALEVACLFVHSYAVLLPLRAVDGVIGGVSVGVALSLLARMRFPERAFAALVVFQFALGGLGIWLLPEVVKAHGVWILFACMAAMDLAAIATALLLHLPFRADTHPRQRHRARSAGGTLLAAPTLAALFLFQAGLMGIFVFIIPLGEKAGLALPFITRTVGWSTWVGIAGALGVVVLGTKAGRVRPLSIAMVVTLVSIAGLYWSHDRTIFFIANAVSAITWAFVLPYLFEMASLLDRSGRLATVAGFVSGLGLASGPFFAGWIVRPEGYAPLISGALLFLLASGVAMLVVARRMDRPGAVPVPAES